MVWGSQLVKINDLTSYLIKEKENCITPSCLARKIHETAQFIGAKYAKLIDEKSVLDCLSFASIFSCVETQPQKCFCRIYQCQSEADLNFLNVKMSPIHHLPSTRHLTGSVIFEIYEILFTWLNWLIDCLRLIQFIFDSLNTFCSPQQENNITLSTSHFYFKLNMVARSLLFPIFFIRYMSRSSPPLLFQTPCNIISTGGRGRQAETQTHRQKQAHSHMQMQLYTCMCSRTVSGLCTQWGLKGVEKPNTESKAKLPPLHVGDRRT